MIVVSSDLKIWHTGYWLEIWCSALHYMMLADELYMELLFYAGMATELYT